MRHFALALCLLAALAPPASAQTFEAATIKIITGERRTAPDVKTTPGNLNMHNVGMGTIFMWAYKLSPVQISNPQVMGSDFYDIAGKASRPANNDELRLMLQALLAERFKLAVHRETKEMSAYALVEAKGGHKLKESAEADGQGVLPVQAPGKMALSGQHATLDQLTMFLSGAVRTPVLDMTGLKGRYDFELDITTFLPQPGSGEPPPDPVAIFQNALPKQLGLRLEARKMPIEMLVIDHIEPKPVEN